jgi:hypothetical protein
MTAKSKHVLHQPTFWTQLLDFLRLSKSFSFTVPFDEAECVKMIRRMERQPSKRNFTGGYRVKVQKLDNGYQFEMVQIVPTTNPQVEAKIVGKVNPVENMEIMQVTGRVYPQQVWLALLSSFMLLIVLLGTEADDLNTLAELVASFVVFTFLTIASLIYWSEVFLSPRKLFKYFEQHLLK